MEKRTILCTLALAIASISASADAPFLFPRPKEAKWIGAPVQAPAGATAIVIGDKASEPEQYAAETLQRYVDKRYHTRWPILRESATLKPYKLIIVLGQRATCRMVDSLCARWGVKLSDKSPGHDGYIIQFGKETGREVAMVGGSVPRGVVYGQDTLFQLVFRSNSGLAFHPAQIRDWPSIPWRGRPHSDIAGYDRPNTFDSFAQARVNFIDLRLGKRIYGTPPGYKLDVENIKHVLKEAHRRGFFVFATVDCAVPKEQYDAVIKTCEQFISLGADGIYISIDDPGADFRIGTSIELLKRIVAFGKKHGITGSKLAMVPGKESYKEIATDTNYKVGHTPGMERVLLFQTQPPSAENLKKTFACGFKIPPGWWLNWPRPRGGFTHIGNRNMRVDGKQPYMDIAPLSEGWWTPSWEAIRGAGKQCSAVHPWGGSIWGNEYTAGVLNLWAWSPEQHDWTEERRRIYDIVFGPDAVEAALKFDDLHNELRSLFIVAPDYPGGGRPDGAYSWPPVLRSIADRPRVLELIARMEEPLKTLDQRAPKGTLLPEDQVVKYYLEPMRASVDIAKIMANLDYPDYWLPLHEQRVLMAVRAGNLEQARLWQMEVRPRLERELRQVKEALAPFVTLDGYGASWLAKLDPIGEARYVDRPVKMTGDLSDPAWATAPKLGNFGYGDALPKDPSEVQLLYTDDALYIGFTCHESTMDKLVTKRTARDSDVWEDDSVEVFLNPDGLLIPNWQFVSNANAVQFDGYQPTGRAFEIGWNGDWEVKTARGANQWTAELMIPFKTLGLSEPRKGRMWMCNFARNDHANDKLETQGWTEYETSAYGARPDGSLHDTRRFRPIWFR